uniref:neuroblastoma breakpoint family member 15-like isoform X3 n=1 Tax=Callithrix jacchus TaxID=9483 RepID=UPI0023DD6123|nr:neuroblastoma breakpoint family member 15-like isoform X3 [Callithrix jacchus]
MKQGALRGAPITDGIGRCVETLQQHEELVLAPSIAMKNPLQMEDDPLEGSSTTQWHQVPGNIDASSVAKPKKIKRKLPFSKWFCWTSRSGCRDCDAYHLNIQSLEKDLYRIGEETIYEELKLIEELRKYKALNYRQTEQLAQLKYELRKVRDASCSVDQHFEVHLPPDDPDNWERQNLREELAKGPRLAEQCVSRLSPENDKHRYETDEDGEKAEKSAAPRLSQELLEAKEQKASEDSLDDLYWALPVQGDLSDYHQPYSSASSSLENQLTCPALDVACEYCSLKVPKPHGPPRQPLYVMFLQLVSLSQIINAGRPRKLSLPQF